MAGTVERVGADVHGWQTGDRVCAMVGARMGAHAEYVVVDQARAVPVPASVSLPDAAAVLFGGGSARHFLHRIGNLNQGARLLVNGATGSVGSAAVQLGRIAGAEVTAITSGRNHQRAQDLGAVHVIDYTQTPIGEVTGSWDFVLDTVGNLHPRDADRLLSDSGILLLAVASLGELITARGRVKAGTAAEKPEDITALLDHLERGEFDPTIDSTFALDDIADAYQRVDSGRKIGNVLVRP